MKGIFIVTDIQEEKIMVSPFMENAPDKRDSSQIAVINPKKFDVLPGTKVSIGFSKGFENAQGILFPLIPVVCCALGVFFYPAAASVFSLKCTELLRFLVGAILFIISFIGVLAASRSSYIVLTPRITGIYTS